ncbi:MAG: type II 3-dehydroquinate dehydratase [Bacteroidetes bacterium]|nr:MAG: type II 3-dehydroquinate dehydratase [Bacteroidota bacterium]REJ99747.1 MAG: type II 3-dehydroquinate dehydratase [Bacteroidota bacterium]REK34120.1 MAG: type II 3-dehydroquinate dehydratase [Bacteroidota bacterium]REK50451.1 MAG: type II 3-dehydroquinate dehydratase [Bacteroidota bacterium]
MKILIINGPNLNLVGSREPELYGNENMDTYYRKLVDMFPEVQLSYFQSNIEGELINAIQSAIGKTEGLIINAGGYTHTSVAIRDAIAMIQVPVIEVHISNVYKREDFRHKSLMASHCFGVIAGFGLDSYRLALLALINRK